MGDPGTSQHEVAASVTFSVNDLVALMRDARKSASYKPALLKALVRCARHSDDLHQPLLAIGREFTKLYWNQTVVYHLRQASALSKESEAVRRIREVAVQYQTHLLSELPESGRDSIDAQMSKVLTINVLEAFHVSKPEAMQPLYEWKRGWNHVKFSPESHRFLKDCSSALELVANFYWAEFLESCNRLAPRIVQKVSRDGATRRPLKGYFKILFTETPAECFYCGSAFMAEAPPAVDHVIPWSFLLEDDLWDLVLACVSCNSRKSDWLPEHKYLDKLMSRNKEVFMNRSLPVSNDEIERFYQAAISVEWPRFWTV